MNSRKKKLTAAAMLFASVFGAKNSEALDSSLNTKTSQNNKLSVAPPTKKFNKDLLLKIGIPSAAALLIGGGALTWALWPKNKDVKKTNPDVHDPSPNLNPEQNINDETSLGSGQIKNIEQKTTTIANTAENKNNIEIITNKKDIKSKEVVAQEIDNKKDDNALGHNQQLFNDAFNGNLNGFILVFNTIRSEKKFPQDYKSIQEAFRMNKKVTDIKVNKISGEELNFSFKVDGDEKYYKIDAMLSPLEQKVTFSIKVSNNDEIENENDKIIYNYDPE
jgi:hypothetical protein